MAVYDVSPFNLPYIVTMSFSRIRGSDVERHVCYFVINKIPSVFGPQ